MLDIFDDPRHCDKHHPHLFQGKHNGGRGTKISVAH